MKISHVLVGSASAIALSCSAFAFAQEAEAPAPQERESAVSRVLQTVTVSATKKSDVEDVQSVPVSVTAYNSDTLDALNVRDLESLSYSSPNVSLDDAGTSRGTANFAIRGLGVNSSIPSIDPAVGVFVDGVYMGLNSGLVLDLFDMESVEVLRGPQGLLFGRNTTGGAVLITTSNPTDDFTARARVTYETPIDDDRGAGNTIIQGIVSGPLIEGRLNGKLSVFYNGDEGYFQNLANGENHGEAQSYIVRGALDWFPTDYISNLFKIQYGDGRSDGPSGQNRGLFERDTFDFSINYPGFATSENTFISNQTTVDVDFGNGTITNIFGYRSLNNTTGGDIDSTPLTLFHSDTELEAEQISNELRYNGRFGDIDLTTGLFYFEQEVGYTEARVIPASSAATFYGGGRQDHTVLGVFGQIDYDFTENFTGIFGLRWSREEKDAAVTYIRPRPECSVVDETCPTSGTNPFIPGESNGFDDGDTWENWTPRLGFQYFMNDTTQFYGNYTRGFRSGGYNFRITSPTAFENLFPAGQSRAFDEETVDSFELGNKWETEDGRGQVNSAVFFTQISDMQREVNLSDPTAGVVQNIVNTADADILGVEVEGRYAVTDSLLVTANIGLIDAEYTSVDFDISGDGVVSAADLDLAIPRVPELTYGFGFIYDHDLGSNGALVTRVNFQHKDEFAYTDNNFGWIQEYDALSANVSWETPWDGISMSVFGDNLLDQVSAGNDTQLPFGSNVAPFVPGGEALGNGVNAPFDQYPAVGTLSPLKRGRVVGIELTYDY
ncbi:TonB-dependent receptor [Ponticaulis sp.]|uniref:TonB-dependent receptor n=1 Tax=Ponticaulis sp. TaxID=2020902 RepID=UPI000B755EDA|nr:TonB-dependent receptor [Ponticaulis sp.]MAI90425.1 TonB-dependent receptor [Ponticaulis sp.]OUY00126.1 MAG: TonB-dependent receptor [Hyphomonadaceae bacterium TMED5]|tara:strand:- start:39573 stop:41912 length:2340 start_codon:yes stop_codon:yes gene_type:complete